MAGLIASSKLYPFMYQGFINGEDLNNYKTSGFYYVVTAANTPPNLSSLMLEVIVMETYSPHVIQRATASNGSFCFVRVLMDQNEWGPWFKYTTTEVSST